LEFNTGGKNLSKFCFKIVSFTLSGLPRNTIAIPGLLMLCVLTGCGPGANQPLWKGSKYTEGDRSLAVQRALAFIAQSAANPDNFVAYGGDYMYCFYSQAETASDVQLRREALVLGIESAKKWTKAHRTLPANANADLVYTYVAGWLTASQLGMKDAAIQPVLRAAAVRFRPVDYLLFDPAKEPPPADIPENCRFDGTFHRRGATVCSKCGRPLNMRSKYDVWLDALIASYTGDRYGVPMGSHYREVIQWLPTMRPYLDRGQTTYPVFIDTAYALTHVVYTLNDYNQRVIPRGLLGRERDYLRRNLREAIALKDPETMGEFLDSLKGLGLTKSDAEIRIGMTYLLDTQSPNGTWSPAQETDAYTLYHSAWTGIDGLKDCRWKTDGLSFPKLMGLIQGFGN
jgi:hypothetical protein